MHVIRRRGWEIAERLATPEHLFFDRRAFVAASGALALGFSPKGAAAQRVADLPDPTQDLYPAKRNDAYKLDRPITPEKTNLTYNNFYEFTTSKSVDATSLRIRPWILFPQDSGRTRLAM